MFGQRTNQRAGTLHQNRRQRIKGRWGILSRMACTGRLRPKRELFSGLRYMKGRNLYKLKSTKGKGNLSFQSVKGTKGFYDREKEMQSSKISMWRGYHLSIEGIWKGVPSQSKMIYKKGKVLDLGAEPPPPPPRIKLCWVPLPFPSRVGTRRPYATSVFNNKKKKCKRQFTLRTSWKLVSSIKEKKLLEMNRRQDSWIEVTATWIGSVHLTSGVQEEIRSQWFSTSMAEEITCKQVCLMSKV